MLGFIGSVIGSVTYRPKNSPSMGIPDDYVKATADALAMAVAGGIGAVEFKDGTWRAVDLRQPQAS